MSKEEKLAADITNGLVRFSVSVENVEDIIEDLPFNLTRIITMNNSG